MILSPFFPSVKCLLGDAGKIHAISKTKKAKDYLHNQDYFAQWFSQSLEDVAMSVELIESL